MEGLEFRVWGLGFRVEGLRVYACGLEDCVEECEFWGVRKGFSLDAKIGVTRAADDARGLRGLDADFAYKSSDLGRHRGLGFLGFWAEL